MNCKNCGALLEEETTRCPVCGVDNGVEAVAETVQDTPAEDVAEMTDDAAAEMTEESSAITAEEPVQSTPETAKPKKKVWKLALLIGGAVVLTALLVFVVLQSLGVSLFARVDAFEDRQTYTVSDEKAAKTADKVIATAGTRELTNSQLQVYYWMQITDYLNYYGAHFDYSQPLDTQVFSESAGTTWQQYFLNVATQTWHRYATLCMLAEEKGYVLSDAQQAQLDQMAASLEKTAVSEGFGSAAEMLAGDMGAAATVEAYVSFMRDYTLALEYFNSEYQQLTPTMDEIDAYYTAHEAVFIKNGIVKGGEKLVDVRHILLYPEGAAAGADNTDKCTQEQWEACRLEAQALLEQWQKDPTEENFSALAAKHSADSSATNGGLIDGIYQGQTVDNFDAWVFAEDRKYGDCDVVKTEYGYHLIYYVQAEEEWIGTARNSLISEKANAIIADGQTKWPMEVRYHAIALGDLILAEKS